MEEIRKINIQDEEADSDTPVEVAESEDVVEVAIAESESVEERKNENVPEPTPAPALAVADDSFEYTESEMSGLTAEQKRRKEIFDKITTGILIALMASPIAIILYIFLWFVFR